MKLLGLLAALLVATAVGFGLGLLVSQDSWPDATGWAPDIDSTDAAGA